MTPYKIFDVILLLLFCQTSTSFAIRINGTGMANTYSYKKAQLSLTNPRNAKACQNCFNSTCLQRCR